MRTHMTYDEMGRQTSESKLFDTDLENGQTSRRLRALRRPTEAFTINVTNTSIAIVHYYCCDRLKTMALWKRAIASPLSVPQMTFE